jgi:hypothetical protein
MGTERSAVQLRRSAEEPDAFGGFYDAHFESFPLPQGFPSTA